jgi:class 3 adenylate cyclase
MMRHADFFGPVVNLASRLSSIVDAGEVAVDNTVDLVGAEQMEPTPLKGIDEPVTPFRIGAE